MFNPSYLMLSRHNVYYFRWPIPKLPHDPKIEYVRLSLGTREPREALRRAKVLEYHALRIIRAYGGSLMNNAEAKAIITEYFQTMLQKRKDRIIEDGPLSDKRIAQIEQTIKDAEEWIELSSNGAELEEDDTIDKINRVMSLKVSPSSSDADKLKANYNLAYPAMLREVLRFNDDQKGFDFTPENQNRSLIKHIKKHTLDEISEKFVDMQMRDKRWSDNTKEEKLNYLNALKEMIGDDFNIADLDAEKARWIYETILRIPVNRNKNVKTRNLGLMAAIEVKGIKPISAPTVKKYLDCYKALFGWCVDYGYIEKNYFQSMRGKVVSPDNEEGRLGFSEDQVKTILNALNGRDIAKKDYMYWGILIGLYTGARLNEVAQLMLEDIKQEDGVWYFDINDKGNKKRLKNKASTRRIPIHQALLDRGILEYKRKLEKEDKTRLLYELTYDLKNGYGKNLGRYFNTVFLKAIGLEDKGVFHTFRHTVATQLTRAQIDERKIKAILGHKQNGVTMNTYVRGGFKLDDLKAVINTLHRL